MGKKETLKVGVLLILGSLVIIMALYFGFKIDADILKIVSGFLIIMIPSLMAAIKSEKVSKIITKFLESQTVINEFIKHRKDIDSLCQLIEQETSETFSEYSEMDTILSDYITDINDKISFIIDKKYRYDFDRFNPKFFKKQILIKLKHISKDINYIMNDKKYTLSDKDVFNRINKKVKLNIDTYILELLYLKDMENGKRRAKFMDETLKLTRQITNHSIDIYNKKVVA